MIIIGKNTIPGILDLSALENLGSIGYEAQPLRIHIRAGYQLEIPDCYCSLRNIQAALRAGFIDIEISYDLCKYYFMSGFTGYDPTKKQVLSNINGTISWITAKDCSGADA